MVKWIGYSEDQNTWEPKASFASPLLVKAFEDMLKKTKKAKGADFESPNCIIAHPSEDPRNIPTIASDLPLGKILN